MELYKYLKKTPSAVPNPNDYLSGHMPSEAIPSGEMSGLVRQDIGQNRRTISTIRRRYASFPATKRFSSSIVSQSLSRC